MKHLYIFLAFISFNLTNAFAQDYSSQLTMGDTPQMNMLNPGYMPSSPFLALPIPILGNINIKISNSFSTQEIIEGNMLMFNKMPRDASLQFGVDADLINLGFRLGSKNFITVSAGIRSKGNLIYPVEIFDFIQNNPLDRTEPFNVDLHSAASSYAEASFGYTHSIDKRWSVGVKLKYLSGLASARTNQTSLHIAKSINAYTIQGDVNMSLGGYSIAEEAFDMLSNNGIAVDLGVHFISYDKRWTAGASILDVGHINWNNGAMLKSANPYNVYDFEGLGNLQEVLDDSFFLVSEKIVDDLLEAIELDTISSSFRESIPMTIHLGGSYALDTKGRHSLTANYLYYFNPSMVDDYSITGGYTYSSASRKFRLISSVTHRRFAPISLGFGLVTSSSRLQFFVMNEVNVLGYYSLDYASGLNFRMGMNILLGRQKSNYYNYRHHNTIYN